MLKCVYKVYFNEVPGEDKIVREGLPEEVIFDVRPK